MLNIFVYFMLYKVIFVLGRESLVLNFIVIELNVGCFEIVKKNYICYFMLNIKIFKFVCCILKIQVED